MEFSVVEVVSTMAMIFIDMFTRSMYDTKHARKSCMAISARTGISPKKIEKRYKKFYSRTLC